MAAHRYWRIHITALQPLVPGNLPLANVTLSGMAMASANGGANLIPALTGGFGTPPAGVFASSYAAGSQQTSSAWISADLTLPCWWGYDFGTPVAIVEVLFDGGRGTFAQAGPAAWDLQYSDDNTTWTTLKSFTPASWHTTAAQIFDLAEGVIGGGWDSGNPVIVHNTRAPVPVLIRINYLSQRALINPITVAWAVSGIASDQYTPVPVPPGVVASFPGGVFPSGTLTFAPGGAIYQDTTIQVMDNFPPQTGAAFALTLSNPVNATIPYPVSVIALFNPDPPPLDLVSLSWSDDRGRSFGNPVPQSLGNVGQYITSLQWRRLGMARDRVFQIEWSAPVATALQGAWVDAEPGQS